MFRFLRAASVLAALLSWAAAPTRAQVALGQIDDFEDGTTQGWTTGLPNPNPPANVPSGGPAGVGDSYLRVVGLGGSGSGGRIVTFNEMQWTGNYIGAGVDGLLVDFANFGASDLLIGLRVEGAGGVFVSLNPAAIPADAQWRTVLLPISADELVGGANVLTTLQAVFRLRIQDATTSVPAAGTLGIDNIRAVPEPVSAILLGTAALVAMRRRS